MLPSCSQAEVFALDRAETCADCSESHTCETMVVFFNMKGHKYRKYMEATGLIRAHGYPEFLAQADAWRGAYGRLVPRQC